MKLVIAEKPSVAREIAKILGAKQKKEGYIEGNGYWVSWAVGHLVTLAEPDHYSPQLKKWSLETLPIMPDKFELKLIKKTAPQYKILANLLKDATEVINACDAGREGELIFRYIYQLAKSSIPIKRLWVSSLTEEALEVGFQKLKDGQEFERLFYAAECRSRGDWLVGMNATRAYTVKSNQLLSIGRVQTPTLGMIVMREREIESFDARDYFEITAQFSCALGTYQGKWFRGEDKSLQNQTEAQSIVDKVLGNQGVITKVEKSEVKEKPPLLYDLTSLQKEANKRFGYTAAKTLTFAQNLYEAKLITYPRTDSKFLSADMRSTFPKLLSALRGMQNYAALVNGGNVNNLNGPRVINDGKVTDHHAIIPTGKFAKELNKDEARIYDLIVRRFLANLYGEAIYEQTIVVTDVLQETFETRGKIVLDLGWKVTNTPEKEEPAKGKKKKADKDKEDEDEVQELPPLTQGLSVQTEKAEVIEKKTKPPKRYTEATLLTAMEKCGRDLPDEYKDATSSGLGTPATRAGIIERLKQVEYITMEKKYLVPTAKGIMLIGILESTQPELISPILTGEWENKIEQVHKGDYSPQVLLQEIKGFTQKIVSQAKEVSGNSMAYVTKTDFKCPLCQGVLGESSRTLKCTNEGCSFETQQIVAGKTLNKKQITSMLEQGRTEPIKGFKSKKGTTFTAALIMAKNGKITFDFSASNEEKTQEGTGQTKPITSKLIPPKPMPPKPITPKPPAQKILTAKLLPCPKCGGQVIEGKRGYGCSNWRPENGGCKFVIWKEQQGKLISLTEVNNLIQTGYSDT